MVVTDDDTVQLRHQQMRLEQRLFGHQQTLRVGRYVLGEWLGSGGMGTVYEARDPSLDRRVAIKVLHHRLSDSEHASARLVQEAKAMARLQHANVLTVHEVGIEDGQPFIAMELMTGGTLADWSRCHPTDEPGRVDAAIALLRQCADGLSAAHDAGLVHRDFKPHNVLLTDAGVAKVADFGLVLAMARTDGAGAEADAPEVSLGSKGPLTRAGATPGTPRYMAPEQRRGAADERSDQYSLCTTFLELFDGAVPPKVQAILDRGARDEPKERFPSVRELVDALDAATAPPGRARTMALSAVVVLGLAVGGYAWLGPRGTDPPDVAVHACDDGGAQLEPLWGEARREALREAFEQSGSRSWRNAWDGVETRLGQYTRDWSAAVLDACEATHIRRVQDERTMTMRLACLDQRRTALERLLSAYARADAGVVDDALTTAHALPPIASCADRHELEYGSASRGLDEPEVRAAYDALGRAQSQSALGERKAALESFRALQPELERLDLPGLQSSSLRSQAKLVLLQGDYAEAATLARRALDQAERADRDLETIRAWLVMAEIARLSGDLDQAQLFLERAQNLAAHRPDARGLQAEVAQARVNQLKQQGKPKEAIAAYDEAIALADEVGLSPQGRFNLRLNSIGALSMLGRDEEARQRAEALVAESTRVMGPTHVDTLNAATVLAQLLIRVGQWQRVEELTRPTLELSMRDHRADLVLDMRLGYAIALTGQQRFDEAQRVLADAIEEGTPLLGADHGGMFDAKAQLAASYVEAGKHREALEVLESMESAVGRSVDSDPKGGMHPLNRVGYWSNTSLALTGLGRHSEAVEAAELSVAICRTVTAAKSVWMFTTLRYAGEVYEQAGERSKALAAYEEARPIADEIPVSPDELAFVDAGLARLR